MGQENDVKNDVKSMLDALEGTIEDEPRTDAPTTDQPVIKDEPKTNAPATDPPADDEPKTSAPTTRAPVDDDEFSKILRENSELKRQLDEAKKTPKDDAPKTSPPSTDPPIDDRDFVGGLDLDELSRDPDEFNKVLNNIYKEAVKAARGDIRNMTTATLNKVPEIVNSNLNLQENLKKLTEDFYKRNEDLSGWKKSVSTVYEELVQENPDKPLKELLEMVGDETRRRIGIKKVDRQSGNDNDDDNPPPLPRKKGGKVRTTTKKLSPLAAEISEMNETLNR